MQRRAVGPMMRETSIFARPQSTASPAFRLSDRRWGEEAWARGKAAYEKGGALLDPPSVPVAVPFTHADRSSEKLQESAAAISRR